MKETASRSFSDLVVNFDDIYQISIIDPSANETISVMNGNRVSSGSSSDAGKLDQEQMNIFREAWKLDEGSIFVSSIDLNIKEVKGDVTYHPLITIATPLHDSDGMRKGVLFLRIYFPNILKLMPEKIFIKAEGSDNLISLEADGTIKLQKSEISFKGRQGTLNVSSGDNVHYITADIFSLRRLLLGKQQDIAALKLSLLGLAVTPASLILLFVSLIGLVAYLNISRFKELVESQKTLIHSLADLTEWRDSDTGCHLERTTKYAVALSRQLQKKEKFRKLITAEFLEDISDASPLHDIGKVGIRDSILLKPGKLTDEEYEQMKRHIHIGKAVLEKDIDEYKTKLSFLVMGKNICAYHHEKYNGEGYIGLKGNRIPLEARIFALCDAYDAIRAVRPYEGEISHEAAVERITRDRGTHFDPDIVDAFIECKIEFLEISNSC